MRRQPNGPYPHLFYGWYVIGAAFFMVLIGGGARQGYGLFIDTWRAEFGASVALLSAVASIGWVANGLAQPVAGRLTDRFGARLVTVLSTVVMGLGVLLVAASPNVLVIAVAYGLIVSFAMGGAHLTVGAALVARWFLRKRGMAMAVLTAGTSVGGIVLIPAMAYMLELTDWRTTWLLVGAVMLVVAAPLLLIVVRNDPRQLGLQPDGAAAPSGDDAARGTRREAAGPLAVERWRAAFRSAPMWQLSLSYLVCGVTTAIISVHFVPFAVDGGISTRTAAFAFGTLSFVNLVGVLVVGAVSDRILRKNALGLMYAIRGAAFVLLVVLPPSVGIWAFAVVAGVSWLATVPLTTSLASDIYGAKNAGVLAGMLTMAHQLGGAAAVFLTGLAFSVLGSYDLALAAAAALLGVAAILSWAVRERAYSARFQATRPPAPAPEPA